MARPIPAALTKQDRTKNKALLEKVGVANLDRDLAAVESSIMTGGFALSPSDLLKPPVQDPVTYAKKRENYARALKSKAPDLVKKLDDLNKKVTAAQKGFTAKTDTKLVTYTKELQHGLWSAWAVYKDFAKFVDQLDQQYKTDLRESTGYSVLHATGGSPRRMYAAILQALDDVDKAGTIANAKTQLQGGNGAGANFVVQLNAWKKVVQYFPELAKSIYPGTVEAFTDAPWLQAMITSSIEEPLNALTARLTEAEAVSKMVLEAEISVRKCEPLVKHIEDAIAAVEHAAR